MKTAIIMVGWMGAASMLLTGGEDLIRFSEGDQLRGKFEGIGKGGVVNWRRDDVDAPVEFKAGGVRHVVLRGGKANPLRTVSHLGLANGDRLPGTIKSIDADAVVLDTSYAGELRVPRDVVALLALYREACMPQRSVLKFDLAWKSRLGLAVGFHVDFSKPEADGHTPAESRLAADVADFARFCGNGYILQLYPNYVMLYRCDVGKDGRPRLERFQSGNLSARMSETGRTSIEIRSNLAQGGFALFINDEFAMQWSEAGMIAGERAATRRTGGGIAFAANGENLSMRISDIMVSEWNGMPDSARSMETEDQDVVLMADGVDRYSGKVGRLDESGKLTLEARHGSFAFPLRDVAEIRFAKNRLARKSDEGSAASMVVRLSPIGSITGQPESGNREKIEIRNPLLGVIGLSLESAVMLDFNGTKQVVDDWDDEF
jgi:hypothetical protein